MHKCGCYMWMKHVFLLRKGKLLCKQPSCLCLAMEILWPHAAHSTLKQLDAIYHCILSFITTNKYHTRRRNMQKKKKVGWSSLATRKEPNTLMFVNKCILPKLPQFIKSLPKSSQIFTPDRMSGLENTWYPMSTYWTCLPAPCTR